MVRYPNIFAHIVYIHTCPVCFHYICLFCEPHLGSVEGRNWTLISIYIYLN